MRDAPNTLGCTFTLWWVLPEWTILSASHCFIHRKVWDVFSFLSRADIEYRGHWKQIASSGDGDDWLCALQWYSLTITIIFRSTRASVEVRRNRSCVEKVKMSSFSGRRVKITNTGQDFPNHGQKRLFQVDRQKSSKDLVSNVNVAKRWESIGVILLNASLSWKFLFRPLFPQPMHDYDHHDGHGDPSDPNPNYQEPWGWGTIVSSSDRQGAPTSGRWANPQVLMMTRFQFMMMKVRQGSMWQMMVVFLMMMVAITM